MVLKKKYTVHRLVAEAFLPNPNNYPCVNHKDEEKTNNFVWVNPDGTVDPDRSNIEWCDYSYNNRYADKNILIGLKESKPVIQYTLNGDYVREWISATKAAEALHLSQGHISSCCRGKRKKHGGFCWTFA